MSEKKRSRKRKDEYVAPGEQPEAEKPSKDEIKVAKWIKKNVKTKKTKFMNHNVEYFTSNKAIDALLKSKFAEGDNALFKTREQVIEFLDIMLEHKFYHRARKVPVTVEELRGAAGAGAGTATTKEKSKKSNDEIKAKDDKGAAGKKDKDTEAELSCTHCCTDDAAGDKKEKRKRKIRLDMHPEQVFVDGSEAYVWIYDPIPLHYWIYGLILLLGAIGICMFPLWPPMLRKGVYYLSVAAAGFLAFILALTVVRYIIFVCIWIITGGKLHFWIFPNLTEDVGFFASFWPLYESKYIAEEKSKSDKRSKSKSKKKEKDSDNDNENENDNDNDNDNDNENDNDNDNDNEIDNDDDTCPDAIPLEPEKIEEIKEHDADMELRRRNTATSKRGADKRESSKALNTEDDSQSSGADNSDSAANKCSRTPSESESEISGKDYEIISSSEVQNVK